MNNHLSLNRFAGEFSEISEEFPVECEPGYKHGRSVVAGVLIGMFAMITAQPAVAQNPDFGDAPISYGIAASPIGSPTIGDLVDAETSSLHSSDALGDDQDGIDDEDGVILPQDFSPNQPYEISVVVSGFGFLSAWVDWNGNGVFEAGEQLVNDQFGASTTLSGTVPGSAVAGFTYVRVRACATAGACNTPTGDSTPSEGEVEDYRIRIVPFELDRMACGAEGIVVNTDEGDWDELDLGGGTVLMGNQVSDGSLD